MSIDIDPPRISALSHLVYSRGPQHVEENDVSSAVQLGRFGQDRVIEGHPLDGRRFVAVSDDQLLWTRELDDLEGLRAGIEGGLSRTSCLDPVDPVDDMSA